MSTKPVQKTAEKKPVAVKKAEATMAIKEGSFEAKKLGANLIATVKGTPERFARKVTKEEGEAIMKKMELYNKRPSVKMKAEIVKMMQPVATAAKEAEEKTVAVTKGLKQQIKKEVKKTKKTIDKTQKSLISQLEEEIKNDATAIPKLQTILDKYKKVEEVKPAAQTTKAPRKGEVYRNGRYVTAYFNEAGVEVQHDGSPLN